MRQAMEEIKKIAGGIVFQSYNLDSTEANIKEVQAKGGIK